MVLVLVSSSGASDWQACEDSHWNKRTTFVFHKNCNSQSLNMKTIRRFIKNITSSHALEVYKYSKAFSVVAWDWGQNRSLRFVSCVFSVWSNRKGRRLTKLQVNTKNQITPKQLILATDFQWTFKEQFSFKFQDNLKIQNKYYILKCESYTPQNW